MKLLERYLLQIEKYLPFKDRKDTIEELKSLLSEEVDHRVMNGQPEEKALYDVIKQFGNPKEVALKYRSDNPIISRELEPFLYQILKIVVIAVPSAILLASIISFFTNGEPFSIAGFALKLLYTIPDLFGAALTAAGAVFVIFVLIERYFKEYIMDELKSEGLIEFDPKHLPKVPISNFKVSIVGSTMAVMFGLILIYILNYQPGLIAVYMDGVSYPLVTENFTKLLPVINVSLIFGLTIELFHIVKGKKTTITVTFEYIHKILVAIIFLLLASNDILNSVVVEGYTLEVIEKGFVIVMYITATANFLGGTYTYIKALLSKSGKDAVLKDFIEKQLK